MRKESYINELKEILQNYEVNQSDIDDVILDYSQMYDDALDRGLTDDEVYQLLGNPDHVISELRDTLTIKRKKQYRNKFIALTPFIAVILFMVIGLSSNVYHPTWLVFLIIPMSAIILNTGKKEKLIALSPFLALIFFITVGTYTKVWIPTWLIFLIIPLLGMFEIKNGLQKILSIGSLLIAVAFYLYMGYMQDNFNLGALGFILPIIVGIVYGNITVEFFNWKDLSKRKNGLALLSVIILSTLTFVLLGIFANGWAYAWMAFLFIPMASIYLFDNSRKLTPFMPFIAVIIFFSLGYFFHLFEISWIAFLLIPMVAVIENA
ncbi:HAAS signaling domain-containing protein [Mariniplasma anaerobium]|uniref:DUF1700 domain-containing protein n=1 Tax=Mariniplasma anaerobium TaxID=2735436 RepID=A0A7U9XVI2_9MOLU|nr:hypothetical protein [Mariniplasma anaerobium]BCR35475.1 hypothetical protein MPAN_003680 [Mariniplasma anaerobium]